MTTGPYHHSIPEDQHLTVFARLLTTAVGLTKIFWLSFWLLVATILVAIPIFTLSMFRFKGKLIFSFVRLWARIILGISGVTVSVYGSEKLEKNRSYVIISNHQSHFDGPALATGLDLQFSWIAKKELLQIPVFGRALKGAGTIFIDRGDHQTAMHNIREAMQHLPDGAGIMVFAEGTRSEHGMIGTFKKGGFFASLQSGFPIVPVTIRGSSRTLPKGRIIFHPGTIELIIGDIIDPSQYDFERIDELIEKTRSTIISNYL